MTIVDIATARCCYDCVHSTSSADETYCTFYNQVILNERTAQTCPRYERETPVSYEESRRRHPSNQRQQFQNLRPAIERQIPDAEAVETYIRSLHATLFGRSFIVTKPEQMDQAVEWVLDLFKKVSDVSV